MGNNPDPSWEELELIFNGFINELDESRILEKIKEKISLPRSRNFLRQRRLHFDVARKVFQVRIEKEVNPIAVEGQKRHFQMLANIASDLIPEGFEDLCCRNTEIGELELYVSRKGEPFCSVDESVMTEQMEKHFAEVCEKYGDFMFFNVFLTHLTAEYPEINPENWDDAIREKPYELIDHLRVLAKRGIFKGKCPICEY
ncbi:hypothetical protein ACFLVW_05400 [Chloroflexota bacterium]